MASRKSAPSLVPARGERWEGACDDVPGEGAELESLLPPSDERSVSSAVFRPLLVPSSLYLPIKRAALMSARSAAGIERAPAPLSLRLICVVGLGLGEGVVLVSGRRQNQ